MIGNPEERPVWVRRLNAMAAGVGGPQHLVRLDADDLIETAQRATALSDFGPDDGWQDHLRQLIASLENEAELHAVGRLMCRHDALRHLCTRLILQQRVTADPSILEREVVAPVFITGPARSGTSILQELLGEDPALRAPLAYEMAHPVPPDGVGADHLSRWAESEFDLWADVCPEFDAVHELRAGLAEECLWLMAPVFDLGFWSASTNVPSFLMHRAMVDPVPTYRYHKMFLQVLQGEHTDRTWVLKSPVHLSRLAALTEVYPDARILRTHRDPLKTMASSASTLLHGRWVRSDAYDPVATGVGVTFGMEMMLNALPTQPVGGRVAELHYLDLIGDPVGAIRAAYATLGLTFTDDYAARIVRYLEQRPQHKHGSHRYGPADFGLDPADIRARFEPYTSHFQVAFES